MEQQASSEWRVNTLNPEAHICFLYETEDQLRTVLASFIREGLEKNEKVLCIADATSSETALESFCSESPELGACLKTGQLTILKAEDGYLRSGVFDPAEMIALLKGYTEGALTDGYAGLRVTGAATWALRDLPGPDRLLEYEARINDFLPGSRCLALCQYPVKRFPAPLLLNVLRTHPQMIIGTEVHDNPHYVPPSILLGTDRSALDLRRWMADMGHRKATDAALRESEAYFREITENASDMILIVNHEGTLMYVSPSVERFLGYRPEELIGKTTFDFFHPADLQRAITDFAGAVQAQETAIPNSFCVLHKDGSVRVLEGLGKNLLDNPAIAGFIMNVQDVTERKRVEEALRESEDRYRDLVENSHDVICTHDLGGRILSMNPYPARLLGYDKDALLQMNIRDILVPEKAHGFEAYLETLKTSGEATGLMLARTRTGKRRIWEYNNTLRTEGVEAPVVRGMARDITDRKRQEKEREKLIQELQKTLSEVRKLSGMLPICAKCKKIRDDQGYWNQVEAYIGSHSDVQFSHSVCPECARKLYPEYYDVMYPDEPGTRDAERGTGDEKENK